MITKQKSADPVVVLGAGLAGLSAAYSLTGMSFPVTLIERENETGGLCRTFSHHGCHFDLGPHVFIHRSNEISMLLHELAGDKLKEIAHMEGIYFGGKLYGSRFDAVVDLKLISRVCAVLGLIMRRARPLPVISCEDGLINTYGSVIYSRLIKEQQRKFWGVDAAEIDVSWARVYEKPISLMGYLKKRMGARNQAGSISYEPAKTYYPDTGARVIYGELEHRIKSSSQAVIELGADIVSIHREGFVVKSVEVHRGDRSEVEVIRGGSFISTIPVTELLQKLQPPPPPEIVDIATSLRYRSLVVANLVVELARDLPYGWLEVHSSDVKVGRITNFSQLSRKMSMGPGAVPVSLEYYCSEGDETWMLTNDEVLELAHDELAKMGFIDASLKCDGFVHRERHAYPMYLLGYGKLLAKLKKYFEQFENLQSIGRGGVYRYNNMGHSIESGLCAAENLQGDRQHDVWDKRVIDGKF